MLELALQLSLAFIPLLAVVLAVGMLTGRIGVYGLLRNGPDHRISAGALVRIALALFITVLIVIDTVAQPGGARIGGVSWALVVVAGVVEFVALVERILTPRGSSAR